MAGKRQCRRNALHIDTASEAHCRGQQQPQNNNRPWPRLRTGNKNLNIIRIMKTNRLILLGLICLTAAMPATAQSRSEKKTRIERIVKEAIAARQYKINVDRMQPMRGSSRSLTTNYTLEVRNDSVFSYLPYFGVAYNAPYGGGKSLNFNAPITGYTTKPLKKGKTQIDFKTRSEDDNYEYSLTVFPDGSTSIHIQSMNKQSISFTGDMDTEK